MGDVTQILSQIESGDPMVGGGGANTPFRSQWVLPASEFSDLPNTHRWITAIVGRPDHTVTTPQTVVYPDFQMRFARTTRGPGQLSAVFALNLSSPLVTVYDGPLTYTTLAHGPPNGPRDFDYYVPLETPFRYDPTARENLIMDFITMSGYSPPPAFDGYTSSPSRTLVSFDPNATTGEPVNAQWVPQLVFFPSCDFDLDVDCHINDLDAMLAEGPIAPGATVTLGVNEQFDLTGDGVIDNADLDQWLADAATINGFASPYKRGDATLDGIVDGLDFIEWNKDKFSSNLLWSSGNFNGDAVVDGLDFIIWNQNKFTSSDGVSTIPEPGTSMLLLVATLLGGATRIRR